MSDEKPTDDKELIERAKNGDPVAMETLIFRYKGVILGVAFNYLKEEDKDQTEDVVNDTFVKALDSVRKFTYRFPGGLGGWLKTVATSVCLDLKRKQKKSKQGQRNFKEELVGERIRDIFNQDTLSPELEILGLALESMPYDCRILLMATYAYGIPPVQIARVTREVLLESSALEGKSDEVISWYHKLFDPLGREMKERRDTCWDKFSEKLEAVKRNRNLSDTTEEE